MSEHESRVYETRERLERDLADMATSPVIRETHLALADKFARLRELAMTADEDALDRIED